MAIQAPGPSLVCRIGGRFVAFPLDGVIETMRPLPVEGFRGAPDFVSGAAVIRGDVVPVVDLGLLLGDPGCTPTRFVTISAQGQTVALAVEAVLGVQTLDESALHDLPPLLRSLDAVALRAIGNLDTSLLLVLGTASLVPEPVLAALRDRGEHQEGP